LKERGLLKEGAGNKGLPEVRFVLLPRSWSKRPETGEELDLRITRRGKGFLGKGERSWGRVCKPVLDPSGGAFLSPLLTGGRSKGGEQRRRVRRSKKASKEIPRKVVEVEKGLP